MSEIKINFLKAYNVPYPKYATIGSAGIDLCANIDKEIILLKGERCLVPTSICLEMPQGYEAQIRPRSGLAAKFGITVLNTPGTIDSDYRGEIKVILINLSNQDFTIEPLMRIAQMVFAKVETVQLIEVKQLTDTERSDGGFGSTGTHANK